MIRELYIRDLGVIREARLPFGAGLNVLTGETGAGKTMVLTALGLLLGERADSAMIRAGAAQTLVEGRIATDDGYVLERVADAGGMLDDEELILNRLVSADKSRAMLGGVSVPAGVLGEIGNRLVVVHGQSDQIRLKSAAAQREALDAYAALKPLLSEYRSAYEAWKNALATLQRIEQNRSASKGELEVIKSDLELFAAVDPKPGEDLEIAELINRLENTESLRVAAATAHEALSSESDSVDVLGLLDQAKRAIEHQLRNDPTLEPLMQRLQDSLFQLRDVSAELGSYLARLDGEDGMSLEAAQERKAKLTSLTRKHGPTLEEAFEWQESAQKRMLELDDSDERVEQLRNEIDSCYRQALALAAEISQKRESAAVSLASEVTAELAALAMKDSSLVVEVTATEELGPHGKDQVSILLRSYPGAEPRPLGKGASGGELSRIMLAIEVVLAKDAETPTFIFDEVDAGIGGAAAIEVGRRLAMLAKQAQVIVVTHLAQVAAFADNHLTVSKSTDANVTESDVRALDHDLRLAELARMLSGLADSAAARDNAAELMSLAKATRES